MKKLRTTFWPLLALAAALGLQAAVHWEIAPYATNVTSQGRAQLVLTASYSAAEPAAVRRPRLQELKGAQILDVTSFNETVPGPGGIAHRAVYAFDLLFTNAPGTLAETGPIEVSHRPYSEAEYQTSTLPGVTFKVGRSLWLPLLLGGLAAAALLAVLAVWALKRRQTRAAQAAKAALPSLEETLLAELADCRRLQLAGDTAEYFAACEGLLRRYLREKYGIAKVEDWQEGDGQRNGVDHRLVRTARELLGLAYNIRYAGYLPTPGEESRMGDFIRELLTKNRPLEAGDPEELYLKQEKEND